MFDLKSTEKVPFPKSLVVGAISTDENFISVRVISKLKYYWGRKYILTCESGFNSIRLENLSMIKEEIANMTSKVKNTFQRVTTIE